ncbi:MAG: CoA transferase [Deltaproteobacteria bacterium]|nr:MAG: CoA transferase [Deltaproteobacteria bacterium]
MSAPLSGVRVVELANFVAAPAAGALLADLGADVIKVEVPWGEIYRHSLPRFAGYDSDFGLAPHFHMDNRGKRSVALDLALPQAVDALRRLVDRADVLVTNMLPARLAKYGLDPAALHARRPELIVARISGFGPVGPDADAPAFDYSSYWARTGFMDMLHEPEAPPAFQRPGMGDHSASLALVVGVLSALRQRDCGEAGQVIDVSLQHIGFYITGNDTAGTLATGQTPPRHDRRAARNPLWNHYRTRDERWVFLVMIESDRYWPELTRAVDMPALTEDVRFSDAVERYRHRAELVRILDERFTSKTLAEWTERLSNYRVIWAPVLTLAEAVEDPQANAFGSFPTVEHASVGRFRTVAPPLRMSRHPLDGTTPAPELGADTEAVLREAGTPERDIVLLVSAATR